MNRYSLFADLDFQRVPSGRGRLSYLPADSAPTPDSPLGFFHPRSRRPQRIHISRVPPPDSYLRNRRPSSTSLIFEKLADTRSSAKRFLRSFIASPLGGAATEGSRPTSVIEPPAMLRRGGSVRAERRTTLAPDSAAQLNRHSIAGPLPGSARPHRPSLSITQPARLSSDVSANGGSSPIILPRITDDKPVASGNGISVGIGLAEPVLFLQGFEPSDTSSRSTAMLRGSLHLRVLKNTKIKAVTLRFKGRAVTKWPEGIPPEKSKYEEVDTISSHTWPFFNAQFPTAEAGPCADHVELFKSAPLADFASSKNRSSLDAVRITASELNISREDKRLSLRTNQSRSFGKGDSSSNGPSVAQKGYRTFYPGDYMYNFELPLDSHLPETIDVDLGSVKYELEATIERAGAFKANLVGTKEVTLIRAPAEGSLEQVEPIAISRNWEDQLHYDIVISGKSFPLGAQVPIAFKLTPLAKVQCHRIKVMITENIEYWANNRRVHRMEPVRKIQLFEKRADGPPTSTFAGSTMRVLSGGGIPYDQRIEAARGDSVVPLDPTNLLGPLDDGENSSIGPTEMEFNVQLPTCKDLRDRERSQRLHFDTTYQNIQVHHWIKIVMRLSKPDQNDPTKRRHFEISIDSPFHILSCRATQAQLSLPAYSSPSSATDTQSTSLYECGCPGAPVRRGSPVPSFNSLNSSSTNISSLESSSSGLARPQQAHIGGPINSTLIRPIHLTRVPSFNPPDFDADEPPPPLETPPPQYDTIASPTSGLADYFARFSDAYEDGSDEDRLMRGGRVNIPLTPGGRLNRSFDEPRATWRAPA